MSSASHGPVRQLDRAYSLHDISPEAEQGRAHQVADCVVLLLHELPPHAFDAVMFIIRSLARTHGSDVAPAAAPPAPPYTGPWTYLIQVGETGPVKIGFSKDPESRLGQLRVPQGPPLDLRRTFPGGRPLEAALHRHFKAYRLEGEWFEAHGLLADLVSGAAELTSVFTRAELAELQAGDA